VTNSTMPLKPFLLRRVAECERRRNQSTDENEGFNFKVMHSMWTALISEGTSMSPHRLAGEVARLVELQSAVDQAPS
jgi:hypothetical protein